ncbi:MAG: HNH endonuclease [Gemmatimonadales bacterium]|nr:MAG: HNH endonuclease [Gemmatimonadales bacterium]
MPCSSCRSSPPPASPRRRPAARLRRPARRDARPGRPVVPGSHRAVPLTPSRVFGRSDCGGRDLLRRRSHAAREPCRAAEEVFGIRSGCRTPLLAASSWHSGLWKTPDYIRGVNMGRSDLARAGRAGRSTAAHRLPRAPRHTGAPIMVRLSPAFGSPDPSRLQAPSPDTLGDEIAELAAQIHVAIYRLLLKLRTFDDIGGWSAGGFLGTAHWLSWRTGISPGAAREKVRVARALVDLPLISAAMARGELSYSKARALTRVADADSERRLLDVALNATAAQVERLVRGWGGLDRVAQNRATGDGAEVPLPPCRLHLAPDSGTGRWRIHGHLEPEVALVLERALAMAAEALFRGTPTGENAPPLAERQAEGMGLLAEAALRAGVEVEGRRTTGRADRFQVMLHVSAETSDDSAAACDASVVRVTHAPDGSILDVGRRTRIVPPALRRALEIRDGGCAHPHCTNRICDAHHIIPWQEGGATSLENLVLLCRRHHRALHRRELSVEARGGARGDAQASGGLFRDGEGRELTGIPPLPALCEDPVAALRQAHAARGLEPATLAALPKWDGAPLDLGLALDWLWRPRGIRGRVPE